MTAENIRPASRLPRGIIRPVLLWILPAIVVIASVWLYTSLGRYVSTDDAYVQARKTTVSPQASGNVVQLFVKENEKVARGQIVLEIEDEFRQINLRRAKAQVESARTTIEALKATYALQAAEVVVAEDQAKFARNEYERQREMASRKLASKSEVDKAQQTYELMRGAALVIKQQMQETVAKLAGDPKIPIEKHPDYRAAMANLDTAELELERTRLRAPRDGIVSRLPYEGDHLTIGIPAFSIIADEGAWIEANFKETDLEKMQPGQTVEIEIDTYPDHTWHGHVESIAQATGAEFALLPPQNASGNWVKVVQRIPVRIAIDDGNRGPLLRAGMSALVSVDTGQDHG